MKFVFSLTQCSFNVILTFMLYLFKILEKWINLCFRSLNLKSCFFAHSTILSHVFFNISQFRFVDSLYVNMLTSFTNSITLKRNLIFSHNFNKFALLNKYNIEKSDESCDMFMLILRFVIVWFLIINVVFLFFRKFFFHFNNLFKILFFFILWKRRKCNTLSKASLTFKLKNDVILFFYSFHIM